MSGDMGLDAAAQELERGVLDLPLRFAGPDEADRQMGERLADPRPRHGIENRRFLDARARERRDDLRQPFGVAAEETRARQKGEGRAREQLARQLQDDLLDA